VNRQTVISRHRLKPAYRFGLTALWCVPPTLFLLVILWGKGMDAGLLDPRFLLPLLLMLLPAAYIWQEGVDVLADGIVVRVFWPRYYAYARLDTWYYDAREGRRVLTVWTENRHKALEVRAAHLTGVPLLLRALKDRVRNRQWPA